MSNAHVPVIYKEIMEAVLTKTAAHFQEVGIEESVLFELSQLWENKLHHLNVAPFHAGDAASPHPPTATAPGAGPSTGFQVRARSRSPEPLAPSPQRSAARKGRSKKSAAAATPAAPGTLPQVDGAFSELPPSGSIPLTQTGGPSRSVDAPPAPTTAELDRTMLRLLSQADGLPEETAVGSGGEEGNLDSELDDEDDDLVDDTENLILCQYEKVTRVKNKWKCILKDGIIHANGRDYVFSKANGDFEW